MPRLAALSALFLAASCVTALGAAATPSFAPAHLALGRAVYSNCAGCHGRNGEGGFAPALAHDARLGMDAYVLLKISRGSEHMPAFGQQLSADQLAAVASFIRSHWNNSFRPISSQAVARFLQEPQ